MNAVTAVKEGNATENQQKMAFSFIINDLCKTFGLNYYEESFDKTAFACGRAYVGQVLLGMTDTNARNLKIKQERNKK